LSTFKETFGASVVDFSKIKCSIGDSFISTGSRCLNKMITGHTNVGVVERKIYEIMGPEGCGKTTVCLEMVASCQKRKGKALYVDAEHAVDISYAKALNVDIDSLDLGEPETGEEALEMVEYGIDNGYDLIIVDSIAAMTPRSELEGEIGDSNMGAHARLMGQGCRRIRSKFKKGISTCIVFTNQIRMKIGILFGNPETTPGGKAMRFFADVRIDMRDPRKQKKVQSGIEIGKAINAKTVKNKLAAPFQKCKIHIEYGKGIVKILDLLQCMKYMGLADFTKKTVSISGKKRMNFSIFENKLKNDKNFRKDIKKMLGEL